MKCHYRILALFVIFALITISIPCHASAASSNYDNYNFTWKVSALASHNHRSTWIQEGEYYLFDFDHSIVTNIHYHYYRNISGSRSTYDYDIYKMVQDEDGLISIFDINGEEAMEHFRIEGKLFKKLQVYGRNGNIVEKNAYI